MSGPVYSVQRLRKVFGGRGWFGGGRVVTALDGIDLDIRSGVSLGIVGESGSGKSTLARILVALEDATDGEVRFRGQPVTPYTIRPREFYRSVQFVFQNSYAAFNPRRRLGAQLDEHLRYLTDLDVSARRDRIARCLEYAQLESGLLTRFPHSLSGGQIQRMAIARGLLSAPEAIVMDESVSALDVSVQARVLRLLRQLQRDLGFTLIFIAHDLAVIDYLCAEVVVMRVGRIVERGKTTEVLGNPKSDYTRELISSCLTV
ncbi:MAG: ATP-binding cassette domain-containing protein [Opitutales bacterium]|nr:ATP-binding cassette domain-containing protein [Opitutales bacterium]